MGVFTFLCVFDIFLFPDLCTNKFFSHKKSRINNCFKKSNDHHDLAILKLGLVSWQLAKRHSLNFALLNLQEFFDRRKRILTLLFFSSNSIEGSPKFENRRKFVKKTKIGRKYLFFVLDSLKRLRDFKTLFFR